MQAMTREDCLRNFENLAYLTENGATQAIRDDAKQWLHTSKIVFHLLCGRTDRLPVATGYESIDNSDALHIDGTWWKAGSNGELLALDDTDLIWYEVNVIDDDADVTLYYMDIRTQLLAGV